MSGTLRLRGSTSGYAELQAAAVAGDQTFILPAVGGTLLTTDSPVGNLTLELGSASQPSLRFEGDTDTGLFSSGANTLNLVTGGSNKLVLGATAHTIFSGTNGSVRAVDIDSSGRVLIGTSSAVDSGATSSIQVVNTSTAILALGRDDSSISVGNDLGAIRFYGNDGGSYQMCAEVIAEADGDHANDDKPTRLVFSTTADGGSSPTPRMTIKSNGSALIGTETSNANDRLTILDPGDSFVSIRSDAAADATSQILDFAVGTGNRASTNLTGTIQAVIHSQAGGTLKSDLKFHTNAGNNITQKMVIKDNGSVGIGDTAPSARCVVYRQTQFAGNNVFAVKSDAGSTKSTKFVVDGDGEIGVGIADPSAGLHVVTDVNPVLKLDRGTANTANANWYYNGTLTGQVSGANADFQISAAGASTPMSFYTNGGYRARLDTNGRLLVGLEAPVADGYIEVKPDADRDNTIVAWGADTTSEYIGIGVSSNGPVISGGGAGSTSAPLIFRTSNGGTEAEKMRLLATGGLTFNGDTAQANALDDYEEGSCIMGLSNATTAPTFTNAPANTVGYYVKIGNMCTVSWYTSSFRVASNGSGVAVITGLPFTVANLNNYYPIPTIAHANCFTSDVENGYSGYNTSIVVPLAEDGITGVQWKTDGTFTYLMFSITYRTV